MKVGLPAVNGWLERHQNEEVASALDSPFGAYTLGSSSLIAEWFLNGLLEAGDTNEREDCRTEEHLRVARCL